MDLKDRGCIMDGRRVERGEREDGGMWGFGWWERVILSRGRSVVGNEVRISGGERGRRERVMGI